MLHGGVGSVVSITTCSELDGPGFEPRWGREDFPYPSRPASWPILPPQQWVLGRDVQIPPPCACLACNGTAFAFCSFFNTAVTLSQTATTLRTQTDQGLQWTCQEICRSMLPAEWSPSCGVRQVRNRDVTARTERWGCQRDGEDCCLQGCGTVAVLNRHHLFRRTCFSHLSSSG
jgi:hypothetical protein